MSLASLFPVFWIMNAFLLIVGAFQLVVADSPDCDALAKNYTAALDKTRSQYGMVLALSCPGTKQSPFHEFLCEPDNGTDAVPLVNDFCLAMRTAGQLGTDFSRKCPNHTIDERRLAAPATPDAFLALATVCETGDPAKYIRAITPCLRKREQVERRLLWSENPGEEWGSDMLSVTTGCSCFNMFMINRPFLCRFMQGALAYANGNLGPGNTVLATCGQEALDVFLELREKALLALNCSEFGNYVKTFKYMNVKYENGTMTD
ncbi:uncharacterized protein LOC129585382 [Paramacrobiotus metropolitanus]|uniref:uncharacterized protein LOC129585382 n=1 Tax=Paramacrobiotus metropolitanus TaxID=2943436 RepID=UPI002445A8BE|nr:uncharacterized protein LOC129585382 [Paramacrobiotus metropolitanus]